MTKNLAKELHEKHAKDIRDGTLACWREDVKNDPSVTLSDHELEWFELVN